jgi:hypothetical protein
MHVLIFSIALVMSARSVSSAVPAKQWTEQFNLQSCSWSSTGRNDFFVLEPGYQQIFEGREGKGAMRLVITVTNETRKIGNVETRIVEEKETRDGEIIEISRNFFAICGSSNDVFYFGEDVDMYKGGKISSHDGSWFADQDGNHPGLFMPSRPLLGARFYQEIAPHVAMDRVEIASDTEALETPAGEFRNCVKTEETTPLEPGAREYKVFARGIGLVQDGNLFLTKYGSTINH